MSVIWQYINHGWRWVGTALSFMVFGIGGVLLPLIVVPVLYIVYRDVHARQSAAKRFIHYSFRFYVGMMRWLGVLDYQMEDVGKLKGAQLVLANHPSLIDVIFLIALIPNANCVVKGRLVQNPFTRGRSGQLAISLMMAVKMFWIWPELRLRGANR
ncbi:hypothetical protein [Aliamphritea spongicola]|nr:hypothetical protein [Aliamphritea spongicola]